MNKNRLRSTVVTLIVAMVLIGMTFGAMADPGNVPNPRLTVSTVDDVSVYEWLGLIGIQYPAVNTDSTDSSINENIAVQNTGFNESEDSKPLPHDLSQTQIGVLSCSYESDFLKIGVGEQYSGSNYGLDWTYLYDPVGHPDQFIHSIYREQYAVATDNWGSVKWSTSFDIDTYFDSEEAPDTATLHYNNLSLARQVNPPVGSAKSFSITYVLTNTGDSTLENVRFFQGIDYDIGGAETDYAWYSEATDTVWQNDDNYFKNGFHGSRTSSHHDCNGYTSMWSDISSGNLNDLTKYPDSGTSDCGIALQWDAGDLVPQASWDLTITFYFGEAAGIEANAGPDQNAGRSQPVTFDASGSSSVGNIITYEWDFDNDRIYDVSVSTPVYVHGGWTELGEYTVGLRVTDDEGRNDTDTVKLTVVPNVDLLVLDITFTPTEINDGNIVIFNATMENIGTEDLTDDFYVRFEVDGSYIGRQQVSGGLPAGGSVRVLQNWEADAGTHNVKAVVDYYNRINESNENNNELSQALPEIPFPDLTVTNLIWSPATDIAHGDTVTFTATVENIGANTSSSIYVRFEIDNCYIGHRAISGLTAGKSTEASLSWHADAGIHNVKAVVDYYDEISESIETNNELVKSLPEILSPDLTVTDIEWIPTAIKDGDTITFNATVNNNEGSTSRDFYVRFEVDGEYIGRKLISGLSAGANTIVTQNWIAYAGSHNVTVYVDEYDAITESDETNNKMSEDLPFIPYPDLTVTNISWMPTNIVGGDAVTFTATVKNVGAGNTPWDFYVRFEVDSKYIGRAKVSDGLDSGNTIDVTQTWTATWANTVNVSVDEYDAVAESNETNNTMSKALPGLPFPDLNVTNLTWDPKENVCAGDPITFTATIDNMGGTFYSTMSNPLKIAFLINDEYVGCRNIVGGIHAGQPLTTTFTWTAQPGTNPTVCVKTDYSDIIPESNEDNNELCETLTLAIKSPDLAIIQLTFEPTGSVHVGDTVKFTAKVANIGEGNYSGDFDVGFYVDDTFAGVSQVFSGIPAGENTFSTFNWTASSYSNPVIKAKADFFDVVRESDEDNNERTEVLPASIPYADLEITDINWTPCENIEDRDPVVFNVTVKNNGPENVVTDFNVYFDIDGYFTRTNLISGGLAAGESRTISFTWKATPGDGHTVTAKADPGNVVPESDKTNNERIQLLPFDVSLVEIFEVRVEPAETTTGIGGQTSCKIKINNHGSASSNFDISVAGLDPGWYILSETSIFLSAGEEGIVDLVISVPDACENSGTFPFPVSVTSQETGITKQGSATLIVEPTPVIHDLLPEDRASLGSDDVTFSWNTYTDASTTIYLKSEDEVDYTSYTDAEGQIHTVVVSNLARNKNYSYYAESTSSCGSYNSPVRTFYIGNGIGFTQDVYEFTVERDYDQRVTIRVQNTDNEYHELLVEVPITYEDLVLGFVGDGSQDNIIPLNPGESKDISLAIQCADSMKEDYELIANLTSTKGDEILTDTARIKIHVHVPCIDYDIEEIGVDPITLTKTFKLTNKGDPITDLTLSLADNLKENAYIEPTIDHFRLDEGASIEFNVVPLLSSADFQAASEVTSALSGVKAASSPGVPGDIEIIIGGHTVVKTLNFQIPFGEGVLHVEVPNVIWEKQQRIWFCNNRPNVQVLVDMPKDIQLDKTILDPLVIKFDAREGARPHDVYISVNGHEVGSLINTVPDGYYKFDVDPSFLIYAERGVATNSIEIHTVHQNGGHYVIGSDMLVHLDLKGYTTHLVASNQEEANQIAADNLPPGFYKAPDSITIEEGTVSQSEVSTLLTSSTTEVLLNKPTTLQTTANPNLMVWAEFDNGDAPVYLAEGPSGTYRGEWTPENYPANGMCVITFKGKGPGPGEDHLIKGEFKRTVKIINPTKLEITINDPRDGKKISQIEGWFTDYYGVQPVNVTVTDDVGAQIRSSDVQIYGWVVITEDKLTKAVQQLSNWVDEGNGNFRCDWTPECPGEYEIEVKAVDLSLLNRESATASVTGTLEAELKITDVTGPTGTIDPYDENYDQLKGELWNAGDRVNRASKKYPIQFTISRDAHVKYSIKHTGTISYFDEEVPGQGEDLGVLKKGTHTAYLDLSKLDGVDVVYRKEGKPYAVSIQAFDDKNPEIKDDNYDIKFSIQREPFFILLDDVAMPYKVRVSQDFANKAIAVGTPLLQYLITWMPILGKVQDATQAFEGVFNAVVEREAMPGLGKFDTVYYYKWRVMPYTWDSGSRTYEQKWVNPLIDLPGISYDAVSCGPSEIKGAVTMKAFRVVRAIPTPKISLTGGKWGYEFASYPDKFWAPQTMGRLEFIKKGDNLPWYFDVETTTLGGPFEAKYVRSYPSQYHYPIYIYSLCGPEPTKRSWGRASKLFVLTNEVVGGTYTIGGQSQQPLQALGVSVNHTAAISSQDEEVSFIISWEENETELAFALYKPDGTKIDPAYAEGDPDVEYYAYEGLKHYRIQSPEPGTWRMAVDGPVGVSYGYGAYVTETELMFSPLVERDLYDPGESIPLSATLVHGGLNVTDVTMTADILRPDANGTWEAIILYDDGSHDDGEAEDGVYANVYTSTSLEGVYEAEIRASGTLTGGDSFSRVASVELLVQDEPVVIIDTLYDGMEVRGTVPIQVSAVDASATIAGYEIWIDNVKASDTNLYVWNTVSANGLHTITAKATDVDGHTGQTAINVTVSDPPDDCQVPQAPTGLSVSAVEPGNALKLNWSANTESDIAGYIIYRSLTSGGPYTKVIGVAETEYIDDGLRGGETYYYVITAVDYTLNESDYSSEASGTPLSPEQGFNGEYSDQGLDINADSLFDSLVIDVGLTIATPGYYHLVGSLKDYENTPVTGLFEQSFDLYEGDQTVRLLFPGWLIYEHGVNGPYTLTDLRLLDANYNQIDFEAEAYTTSSYNYADFETSPVEFTDSYSDFGADTDDDGFFDTLTVSVGINVTTAGNYVVTGILKDSAGHEMDTASYFSIEHFGASDTGDHTIALEFSGISIRKQGVDGPYYLMNLTLFYQSEASRQIGYRSEACTTNAYNYTDFQKPPVAFTGSFSDRGTDTNGDGKYDYLAIDIEVDVEKAGGYNISGRLEDVNGNEIAIATRTVNIAGKQTVQLNFDGLIISGHRMNGPYKIKDLLIYNVEDRSLFDFLSDAYTTTSEYNYSDFQTPPLDLTLSPTDITFSNDAPIVGEYVTISAIIHNDGTVDANGVVVQFFDGNPAAGGVQIETDQIISSIAHESTGTAHAAWAAIPGTHDIFVRVDPFDSIQESNEGNNIAFNIILLGVKGDLNNDGTLTPADAVIALQIAAGSHSFDPATLATADVSGDNRVTSLDALMILRAAMGSITL